MRRKAAASGWWLACCWCEGCRVGIGYHETVVAAYPAMGNVQVILGEPERIRILVQPGSAQAPAGGAP